MPPHTYFISRSLLTRLLTKPLQLILDNGAAEYVLRPTAEDADVLVKLFARSANATFDLDRQVLMFGNLAVK